MCIRDSLVGDEVQITFTMEGYGDVIVWINIRSEGTNILNIELLEGNTREFDNRKDIAKPWPPNYALAPIFIISESGFTHPVFFTLK